MDERTTRNRSVASRYVYRDIFQMKICIIDLHTPSAQKSYYPTPSKIKERRHSDHHADGV